MVRVLKFGIVFLGLLFGTPLARTACLAMNQNHGSSMQHCDDDATAPDATDTPASCCVVSALAACNTTLGSCCSVSQQKLPAKTASAAAPITARLARVDFVPAPSSVKYRHDRTPALIQTSSSDRQAILSSFLI